MKLLALDTSTDYLSLALDLDGRRSHYHAPAGQQHAEQLLPRLTQLLADAGVTLHQLDAIAFGQGPGSFTGLRIACGITQGLAVSAGLAVYPIPTLDSVAAQADGDKILVCLDARMGQVYWAAYQGGSVPARQGDYHVSAPEEVAVQGQGWQVVGNGLSTYRERFPAALLNACSGENTGLRPHALALLDLALSGAYPARQPHDVELLYVRDKVALTAAEQQARRA